VLLLTTTLEKNIVVPVPGDVMCGVCVCVMCGAQCEISTVLSRYDVKAIRDLVRKTNVSLWTGGPYVYNSVIHSSANCTLLASIVIK